MTATFRATALDDLPALAKFLIRVYGFDPADHHADPRLLEWKYLSPSVGRDANRSYLIETDGKIMAHCGICPVTFRRPDGKIVPSATMMDWAADSSAPGVGVRLFRKLMAMSPTSFVVGGAPATRLIVPRIGFRSVGEALTYSVWLRPWREFRERPQTRGSALRLLHGLTHPARNRKRATAGWDSIAIDQFNDSLLPVLNGTKRSWTFCQRSVSDLNHLLKCPHLKMQGYLLRSHGRLLGYFVIGTMEWEARLLDMVVDSADEKDWNVAYAMATVAAQADPAVCRVRLLSTVPILSRALVWNGYWRQYKEPIVLHDPDDVLGRALPASLQLLDNDSGY